MRSLLTLLSVLILSSFQRKKEDTIVLVVSPTAHVRIQYGVDKLAETLAAFGYKTKISRRNSLPKENAIIITDVNDPLFQLASKKQQINKPAIKEGFTISSIQKNIFITGADETGTLYGCIELADQLKATGSLPENISISDAPQMVLRGTCIGLQKTNYLPGRAVYEYPYTPESFPWFYDKKLWLRYLDSLAANRYNSLYLWNGHPFASLVRLDDYPYAVEVDDSTFRKNEEIFQFLTTEADKRGIWIIQMFYNILISKPFAERHGLKTQDRATPIIPIVADYTKKSIAAFVKKYPNVGLLVTLGEALEGEEREVEWFTKIIIGGVQDGLSALGTTEQPPIVLRGHDTNPQRVMKAALPLYKNLYTMNKYNGEALTTYEPRGPWAQMHRELSRLGSVHIDNVHILANLEPFRYGSADFIQKSVNAMHNVHGANGLHLYPESSYWDWPYTADNAQPRLLQIERDWLWYKEWARYAWNADRDRKSEITYWSALLAGKFGCNQQAGQNILTALEESGEIAPKLLRRFGITNGNRQTLTLGMTMSQLINPHKYRVWPELYSSDGPEGEMLIEYAAKQWKGEKHTGETPAQIIKEVATHGYKAVQAIDNVSGAVTTNKTEFNRLQNDMHAYRALANFFSEKVLAAELVLRFKYSGDINDLDKAYPHLQKSVQFFSKLSSLTKNAYLYANSMQTGQRKIPVGGDGGKNKTWVELLPFYEHELNNFKRNLDSLREHSNRTTSVEGTKILQNETVTILNKECESYAIENEQSVFLDTHTVIKEYAAQLKGLKGLRFSRKSQEEEGTAITFKTSKPIKMLVGYFAAKEKSYLQPSNLETDASANDYGQAESKILNAILIEEMPPVNVHAFAFKPGTHTLKLGKGAALVLGFIRDDQPLKVYDAGLGVDDMKIELDWLFE
jgi:hypothetical protein